MEREPSHLPILSDRWNPCREPVLACSFALLSSCFINKLVSLRSHWGYISPLHNICMYHATSRHSLTSHSLLCFVLLKQEAPSSYILQQKAKRTANQTGYHRRWWGFSLLMLALEHEAASEYHSLRCTTDFRTPFTVPDPSLWDEVPDRRHTWNKILKTVKLPSASSSTQPSSDGQQLTDDPLSSSPDQPLDGGDVL